jgi:IS4 transposase
MYLTNVFDPPQLSLADIARLYARSFDIELAFLTLKRELDLHSWWSSKRLLMWQQVLVVLLSGGSSLAPRDCRPSRR